MLDGLSDQMKISIALGITGIMFLSYAFWTVHILTRSAKRKALQKETEEKEPG